MNREPGSSRAENPERNVLLITADSIRADYCGFIEGTYDTTPRLDGIAERSYTFHDAIAPGPRTPSSVPVILSGRHAATVPDEEGFGPRYDRIATHVRRFGSVADDLKRRGYTTAAFTANPWTTSATGFDRSFDEFRVIGSTHTGAGRGGVEKEGGLPEGNGLLPGPLGGLLNFAGQWAKKTDWFAQWPTIYRDVLEYIETAEEPWFLWVFLLDTHSPYIVPREYREEITAPAMYYSALRYNLSVLQQSADDTGDTLPNHLDRYLKRSYRDSIRSIDRFVGALDERTDADRTALVFHSDHGEAFNEHGTYSHQPRLYEENVRVPLLVQSGEQHQREVRRPVSLARLRDIVGSLASGERFDPERFTADHVVSQTEFRDSVAVRGERWKYIADEDGESLFDLRTDPHELGDRRNERGDILREMRARHGRFECRRSERRRISATISDVIGEAVVPERSVSD